MKIKWHLHNDCKPDSIEETLDDVPESIRSILAEEIYKKFYEVEFEVEVDDNTGKITKIIPKGI